MSTKIYFFQYLWSHWVWLLSSGLLLGPIKVHPVQFLFFCTGQPDVSGGPQGEHKSHGHLLLFVFLIRKVQLFEQLVLLPPLAAAALAQVSVECQ